SMAKSAAATSAEGEALSRLPDAAAHHNDRFAVDVDGDGVLAPIDALLVINYLNAWLPGGTLSSPTFADRLYYDVDGDGTVAPIDAVLVINSLNTQPRLAATIYGEGEQHAISLAGDAPIDLLTLLALDMLSEQRRRLS